LVGTQGESKDSRKKPASRANPKTAETALTRGAYYIFVTNAYLS